MLKKRAYFLWITCLVTAATCGASESRDTNRVLNPYHEQQLQDQIQKCASGVMACSDAEQRCLKQQELCQLLIRSDRYDEALQVANNIFKTDSANGERRAAHHFLMAEIYNRKMKASRTLDDMEKNRQYALSAAQEVISKNYPSKWGVSEHARALIRNLSDAQLMAGVKQRVAARQGAKGDSAKEAIADAQRKYLDQTQGRISGTASSAGSQSAYQRVMPPQQEVSSSAMKDLPSAFGSRTGSPAANVESVSREVPQVTRVLTPVKQENAAVTVGSRLEQSGLLTSQPGSGTPQAEQVARQPLTVNGQPANNVTAADEIAKNNLAQLLESARKRREERRSPYASGENPAAVLDRH